MKINNRNLLEHLNIIEKNQLNIIKNKLKKLFNLIVNFKKLNSVIYFIGFSEFSSKKYYKFLKQFNIISLNNETWVNGLISNSVYMNKYLRNNNKKKKKSFNKEFGYILKNNKYPDLIIFYENTLESKDILKECLNLKIPVIIIFDHLNNYSIKNKKLFSIFNSNYFVSKNMFDNFFSTILISLLKREAIYKKKNDKKQSTL